MKITKRLSYKSTPTCDTYQIGPTFTRHALAKLIGFPLRDSVYIKQRRCSYLVEQAGPSGADTTRDVTSADTSNQTRPTWRRSKTHSTHRRSSTSLSNHFAHNAREMKRAARMNFTPSKCLKQGCQRIDKSGFLRSVGRV